jgi:hypothetical protein
MFFWGVETEANPYACGPWIRRRQCRRADLALYSMAGVEHDPATEIPFLVGWITRTPYPLAGSSLQPGPLDATGSLVVYASKEWLVVGEPVQRIGATTGWQTGTVLRTCFDMAAVGSNITLVCNDEANTFSLVGDSGGPMFQSFDLESGGQGIVFVGLNHGNAGGAPLNQYSSLRQMKQEYPSLCFWIGCPP